MEDLSEQIVSSLAVIHRFMSAHTVFRENLQGSSINVHETIRLGSVSEAEHSNTINIVRTKNKMKSSTKILGERLISYIPFYSYAG